VLRTPSTAELGLWTRVDDIRWPQSSHLAIEGSLDPSTGQVAVVDPLTDVVTKVYAGKTFAWSPGGDHLAAVGWIPHFAPPREKLHDRLEVDGEVVYAPTPEGTPLHIRPPLAWNRSADGVAFVEQRGEAWRLVVVRLDGSAPVSIPLPTGGTLRGWSDAGRALWLDGPDGGHSILAELGSQSVRAADPEVVAERFGGLMAEQRRHQEEESLGPTASCTSTGGSEWRLRRPLLLPSHRKRDTLPMV